MRKLILLISLLFITSIIVNLAYACVDCDLNKKAFEKDLKVKYLTKKLVKEAFPQINL